MKHVTRIVFCLSLVSIIYIISSSFKNGVTLTNPAPNMTATITNEIVPYETEYVYNASKPSTAEPVVLEEGINGLNLTYDGLNYTRLSDVKNEIVEVGTGKEGEYTGTLTGYGPDCPGCSSVGNVSCLTKKGTRHSLINDGVYYEDETYGNVRIIAADTSAFPCGTIINIDNGSLEPFAAIVLDSGYSMRKAWSEGKVWIDLAFSTENDARNGMATSKNAKFSVQRWGF